jgi:hypothetical protein
VPAARELRVGGGCSDARGEREHRDQSEEAHS